MKYKVMAVPSKNWLTFQNLMEQEDKFEFPGYKSAKT